MWHDLAKGRVSLLGGGGRLPSMAPAGGDAPLPSDSVAAWASRRLRLHDLGHYVATQLVSAGVDTRTVAGRLGHASPSVTLSTYAAWVPARTVMPPG